MLDTQPPHLREVYLVDGARTPFLKAKGKPGPFAASDLAVLAGQQVLLKQHTFKPSDLDEVILGCVMPSADEANIGRVVSLRLGCGKAVPAWTVQRNCASGMQALDNAFSNIAMGRSNLVLAGGTEAMSRAPLLFNSHMTAWFAEMAAAKDWKARLKSLLALRPSYFKPVIALLRGLTDPLINLSMGQTAEVLAYQFNISRQEMDQFSLTSHQRAAAAIDEKRLAEEVKVIFSGQGECFTKDDGVRRDTSMEKLATLKAFFDKKFGNVTAGNSAQITDGAAIILLASKAAVEQYQLPVLAKIVGTAWAGVEPAEMGLGPVYAANKLMKQFNLKMEDIDYWEINEAFAAQVLACLKAFDSADYGKRHLGREGAVGSIDPARLNVDGGAIAVGHPVGASGARIALHLAMTLRKKQAKRGIATLCIGGGQGGAMLIETAEK
jgi:acetyl-CoA C-acetyltransferase